MLAYTWRRPRHVHPVSVTWLAGYSGGSRLPVDVREDDESYEITAAVPGLTAEQLDVQVLDDVVTLRVRVPSGNGTEKDYLLREIRAGEMERSFRLPKPIDASKAEAVVENGLLRLRLPKAEAARPKTIPVAVK